MIAKDREPSPRAPKPRAERGTPGDEAAALERRLDASLTQLEHQLDSTKHYLANFEPSVAPKKPPAKSAR